MNNSKQAGWLKDKRAGMVLFALRYAKELISTYREFCPCAPEPPMSCINETIRMIETGKMPWESVEAKQGSTDITQ